MLKPPPEPMRRPFEGVDLREAGRKGGYASAASRKLRHQRQLEAKVAESRNGYAILKLAEKEARRNRELEQAQIAADLMVCSLMDDADRERAIIAELIEETRTLEAQVEALEARRLALSSIDDAALVQLLTDVGEQRVERACIACGWLDDEDVDDVA